MISPSGTLGQLQGASAGHRHLEIEVGLHVHPELRCRLEELRQPQGGVGGHAALPTDELVHADGGHPERLGGRRLRHFGRLQELLEQDLAG